MTSDPKNKNDAHDEQDKDMETLNEEQLEDVQGSGPVPISIGIMRHPVDPD